MQDELGARQTRPPAVRQRTVRSAIEADLASSSRREAKTEPTGNTSGLVTSPSAEGDSNEEFPSEGYKDSGGSSVREHEECPTTDIGAVPMNEQQRSRLRRTSRNRSCRPRSGPAHPEGAGDGPSLH